MPDIRVLLGDTEIHRSAFDKDIVSIGRSRDNDVVIENLSVSRNHARIRRLDDGRYLLSDLNSANGTLVNGLKAARVELRNGDTISIGKYRLIFSTDTPQDEARVAQPLSPPVASEAPGAAPSRRRACVSIVKGRQAGQRFLIPSGETTLGRAADNDIRIQDWFAARYHAVILTQGQDYFIRDLGSWKGTELDGEMIQEALLTNKSDIRIGSTELRFEIEDAAQAQQRKAVERIQMFPESTFALEAVAAPSGRSVPTPFDSDDDETPEIAGDDPSTRRTPETLAREFLQSIPALEAEETPAPPASPAPEGSEGPPATPAAESPTADIAPPSQTDAAPKAMDGEGPTQVEPAADLADVIQDISASEPAPPSPPVSYPDSAAIEGAYVAFSHSRDRQGPRPARTGDAATAGRDPSDGDRSEEDRPSAPDPLAFLDEPNGDGDDSVAKDAVAVNDPDGAAGLSAQESARPEPPLPPEADLEWDDMSADDLAARLKARLQRHMGHGVSDGEKREAPVAAPPTDAGESAPDKAPDEALRREVEMWELALNNPSAAVRREAAKTLKKLTGRDYDA